MRRNIVLSVLVLLVGLVVVLPDIAMASGTMPWAGPLDRAVDEFTGPTAKAVFLLLSFGMVIGLIASEGGGMWHKVAAWGLGGAVLGSLGTWVPEFFSLSGGALL